MRVVDQVSQLDCLGSGASLSGMFQIFFLSHSAVPVTQLTYIGQHLHKLRDFMPKKALYLVQSSFRVLYGIVQPRRSEHFQNVWYASDKGGNRFGVDNVWVFGIFTHLPNRRMVMFCKLSCFFL